jgi:hypothetical protein
MHLHEHPQLQRSNIMARASTSESAQTLPSAVVSCATESFGVVI